MTGGDWDTTTLYRDGEEFLASQLYIDLKTMRDEYGETLRGGIENGGEMTAFVVPQDTDQQVAIFPGKIDLDFPTHKVVIENSTPNFAIEFTRVWLDNNDITDQVVEMIVNIDAVNNEVSAYVIVRKPHFFGSDEVATYTLL